MSKYNLQQNKNNLLEGEEAQSPFLYYYKCSIEGSVDDWLAAHVWRFL